MRDGVKRVAFGTPLKGVLEQRSFLIKIAACCSGGTAPNWGLRPRSPAGEFKFKRYALKILGCLRGDHNHPKEALLPEPKVSS